MMTLVHYVRLFVLVVGLLFCNGCRSPYFADRGAALGGLAGGLTGAALGDSHGNAAGGALIGGAVGALTGAAIGDSMDAEVERRMALIEARTGQRMAGAVTTTDVMTLASSGLSDEVIVNHVRANGVAAPLTPSGIIELHENGVSEHVINAMQQTAARQSAPPPVPYGTPVIIEETCAPPPYWHPSPYPYPVYRQRYYRRRPGMSWGFSVAH